MAKEAAAKKPFTKTQIVEMIATQTNVSKKDVAAVLASLNDVIAQSFSKKGAGKFVLPGIVKLEKKKIPARKAQKNVPNPFKPGEFRDVPAKPAHDTIKVRALKGLKDMV
ncbi:MAG: HU family DNA-binding protein [Planctomycetia bacterium]|nr:HU family DNA-binding protein [Planctomycetia bacterium]